MDGKEVETPRKRGLLRILWGMLARPRGTLKHMKDRATFSWWLPALLVVLMTVLPVAAGAPLTAEQAREAVLTSQERMAEQQGTELSEEQQAQMERLVASPLIVVVFPAVAAVVGLLIGWVVWTGSLYLAGMVVGGRGVFGDLFGMVIWTWLPYAVRGMLQAFYILVTGQLITNPGLSGFVLSSSSVEQMMAAPPSLGELALSSLLSRIDLFLFWRMGLLTVGVAIVMQLRWRKALVIVVGLWMLLTALGLIPTLVGGMFSGMVDGS